MHDPIGPGPTAPAQAVPAMATAQPSVARLGPASLPETFERILESVTDAWVAMDAEWHITYANPAAERLLQRDRTRLVGGRFWEDFPVAFVDAFSGPLEQAARDRTVVEVDRYAPTLYRWFEVCVYPTAAGVALCARDVTDRRRQQEALRRTETAARQNQKLEAIGRLAGGIAHDFNNLLTAIKGYSDLILADLVDVRDGRIDIGHLRDDIDQIRKAADSAAVLTGQLLAFGRQQVMQPRRLDLNVYVAETEKMLRRKW
jgi:PAS domain S-box-containing protein